MIIRKRTRIRRCNRTNQVVDLLRRLLPVNAAILWCTTRKVGAGFQVKRNARRSARNELRQRANECGLSSHNNFLKNLERRVITQNRHTRLRDQIARVRLHFHVVERCASLGFAVDHRPVGRHTTTIFRQQRAVHVERTALRNAKNFRA